MNSKSKTWHSVEKMSNKTNTWTNKQMNERKIVTMLLLMYLFLCIAFDVQSPPVCHERFTIIEFVQCRACCFFRMNVKEREGNNINNISNNNNNNNTKPEKPFLSCVCSYEAIGYSMARSPILIVTSSSSSSWCWLLWLLLLWSSRRMTTAYIVFFSLFLMVMFL